MPSRCQYSRNATALFDQGFYTEKKSSLGNLDCPGRSSRTRGRLAPVTAVRECPNTPVILRAAERAAARPSKARFSGRKLIVEPAKTK